MHGIWLSSRNGIATALVLFFLAAAAPAKPLVIDDQKILDGLHEALSKAADEGGIPAADDLAAKAKEADSFKPRIALPEPPKASAQAGYEQLSRSVFLISSVYKCGKCNHWHRGSSATAWCLGKDGLMVTNAHVFRKTNGGAIGVTDREGNCYPVTALLGIDVATDIAVFRVKADDLQPLRLGAAAEVGSPVTVISNPAGNLFMQTSGAVARYSKESAPKGSKGEPARITRMAITADFAVGSSGGPVFNDLGEVVGMVSSTRSIYTEAGTKKSGDVPKEKLQMIVKSCVPVDAIRSLFAPDLPAESAAAN